MALTNLSNQLAVNPQALDQLRSQAQGADTREGIKAAARQFETYFLQMMLRNMRETLSQDGLFDSQETKSFTEMFDQQLSQTISQGKGIGLTDMLLAQIERSLPKTAGGNPVVTRPVNYDFPKVDQGATGLAAASVAMESSAQKDSATAPTGSNDFIQKMWPHAVGAAKTLGVPPQSLLAQAALESGWGKRELKNADGSNTYNLFNIKAGSHWTGAAVARDVSEYKHGNMVKSTEKFRAYGSYEEAFADYAKLISGSSRYSGAVNQDAQGFAAGLQQGGFATDPAYASKIMRVFNSPAFRDTLPGDALQGVVG